MFIFGACDLGLFLCVNYWWQELHIDPSVHPENGYFPLSVALEMG